MNKTIYICLATVFLLVSLLGISIWAMPSKSPQQDASQPPCSDCHVCNSPTKDKPCLEGCLYSTSRTAKAHSATEGPDISILGELEDLYFPVRFDHKHHAEMVGMGKGCTHCHHYSPPGKFPPCGECHSDSPTEPQSLRQPGLKGAYHRQCMGCHREWSHDTKCVVCHLPHEGTVLSGGTIDTTDIVGISHPVITAPYMRVWTTPYKAGPIVTLHHQEHIDLFGLKCVDCHKQENCSYCHDLQKENRVDKTDEEIHAICNDCHQSDPCSKCHDTGEKPAFTHASNGNWILNRFHQGLSCRACHPTGRKIGPLSTKCANCHGGWNQANFQHAVTGLQLDDIHTELDCSDCHESLVYGRIPKCYNCHDDCRNHEDAPPGEYVQTMSKR